MMIAKLAALVFPIGDWLASFNFDAGSAKMQCQSEISDKQKKGVIFHDSNKRNKPEVRIFENNRVRHLTF